MNVTYLQSDNNAAIYAWAKRLVDDLNRTPAIGDYPTFANDAAAAAGNVKIGEGYVTADGAVRRRMA